MIPLYSEPLYSEPHQDVCSICLEHLDCKPAHTLVECNHVFHASCLIDSLRVDERCPLCRGMTRKPSSGMVFRHILSYCKSKKNKDKKLRTMYNKYAKTSIESKNINKEMRLFRTQNKETLKKMQKIRNKQRQLFVKLRNMKRMFANLPILPIRLK